MPASDLNNCIPSGLLGAYFLTWSEGHINKPTQYFKAGILLAINIGGYIVQLLFDYNTVNTWCRKKYSDTWTEWSNLN